MDRSTARFRQVSHRSMLAPLLGAFALLAVLLTVPQPAGAAEAADSALAEQQEWQLLDLINGERAAAGLRPLLMQTDVRDYARFHARDMRAKAAIWHDLEQYKTWLPTGWRGIAENVAYNSSVTAMHTAYLNSPGHRANILNPGYTHVGIAIMASGATLYNSQNFLHHPSTTLSLASRPGAAPADTTAPAVSLTAPSSGATVSGTVTVNAAASDNVAVTKVEFLVDGAVKSADTVVPYAYAWNTTITRNAVRALTARAYDAAGNVSTSVRIDVTVRNADTVAPSIVTGLRAARQTGYLLLQWTAATDNVGVAGYRIYVGTRQIGTTTSRGFADFRLKAGTTRSYTVRAYDRAGNLGPASAALVVTVA